MFNALEEFIEGDFKQFTSEITLHKILFLVEETNDFKTELYMENIILYVGILEVCIKLNRIETI